MKTTRINKASEETLKREYEAMYLNMVDQQYEKDALKGIYRNSLDRKTKKDARMLLKNIENEIYLLVDNAEIIGFTQKIKKPYKKYIVQEFKKEAWTTADA